MIAKMELGKDTLSEKSPESLKSHATILSYHRFIGKYAYVDWIIEPGQSPVAPVGWSDPTQLEKRFLEPSDLKRTGLHLLDWDPGIGVRLSGPIQFLRRLLETWHLTNADAVQLLGLEASDVTDLLQGHVPLKGRDAKDRIAYLFRIRKTLSSLFQDTEAENEWLREPHEMLGGQKPLELLLEGAMENLLLVKEYVAAAAGR